MIVQTIKSYKSTFVNIDRTKIKTGGHMSYYFSTKIKGNFDDIVQKTTEALKKEGFGFLTDIDVSATLKKKLINPAAK